MTEIPIITYEAQSAEARRNPDNNLMGPSLSLRRVSAESLQSSFEELVVALGSTLTIPDAVGPFQVGALDVQLELTAEGQIGLLGNGGKLGGKGSLTLRLKRPEKLSAKVGTR
jgi:hypothetical protein